MSGITLATMLPQSLLVAMRSTKFLNTLGFVVYQHKCPPNVLDVYADADFAMDLDNQRFKINFVLFLNNTPVAWGSRKQLGSSSTTEEEYDSAVSATNEMCGCEGYETT